MMLSREIVVIFHSITTVQYLEVITHHFGTAARGEE